MGELGDTPTRSLDALAAGEVATVVGFDASDAVTRRLFDLGFAPGVEIVRLRRAPLGDPVMFRVGGTEIVLRKAQARLVRVSA